MTAQHVANDFYSMKLGWVVFDRLPQFDRRETECIFQDERLDLAVIHVRPKMTRALGETLPLDLSDLGTEEDFSAAVPNNGRNYGLLGLPGILAELVQPNRIELRPLIYETVVIASGDHATLELGFHSGAPDPHGISGSLVFELPDPKPDELWHPGKAIALEHRWSSSRQTILCSPVHPVRAAIAAHGSSGVD